MNDLLSLVDVIAWMTDWRVYLDLMLSAPASSCVSIVVILSSFSFAGMYKDTNEVPFLKKSKLGIFNFGVFELTAVV